MTAPKPKVRFRRGCDGNGLWTWDCDCGSGGEFCDTSLLVNACDAAAYHSRSHTAERIADELERLAAVSTDCGSSLWIAYRDSSHLIRKHLT